ncbi:MAG: tetratricopeptide repeat protein [Treponema sp.]|nr:tetratricopeptide repeat protein [Treponema sp.]
MQENQPAINERIAEFVQRNRKPIAVTAIAVVAVLVGSIVTLVVTDFTRGRAIAAVEELGVRYEALVGNGLDEELMADLRVFASRNSGYAGGRAWSMLGSIYGRRGEWAEAEAAWLAAAGATSRSYMAPIALFNAAAAAEEQGGLERAIYHYQRSISAPAGFFAAPRAQFSIGRLYETLGDDDAAIRAYRDVIFGWPHDTAWTNLAHSRIIALETRAWRLDEPVIRPADVDFQWFDDDGIFLDFGYEEPLDG